MVSKINEISSNYRNTNLLTRQVPLEGKPPIVIPPPKDIKSSNILPPAPPSPNAPPLPEIIKPFPVKDQLPTPNKKPPNPETIEPFPEKDQLPTPGRKRFSFYPSIGGDISEWVGQGVINENGDVSVGKDARLPELGLINENGDWVDVKTNINPGIPVSGNEKNWKDNVLINEAGNWNGVPSADNDMFGFEIGDDILTRYNYTHRSFIQIILILI